MERTLASCRLRLAGALDVLEHQALVRAVSPGVQALSGEGVLQTDSRRVRPGDVFLAYRGVASDGHAHLGKAAAAGASLLVIEETAQLPSQLTVPWIQVTSGRGAWAHLAAEAFGHPERQLTLLGVTGTNGKTSTVWMTGDLLRAAGIPCLTIGTLGAYLGDDFIPTRHTTPDPDALYALFAAALARGIRHVAMEVSSHAICQEKLLPLRFAACAFTSFSRDHLDFHASMDEYFAAKTKLFTELARPDARRAFADGLPRHPDLHGFAGRSCVYGFDARARQESWGADDFLALATETTGFTGTQLGLVTKTETARGHVPYFARHALENFGAAAFLAASVLGHLPDAASWNKLTPVPGRLEQVTGPKGPNVVVDYAHTPDALEKTLTVLRPLCTGRLAVVFGCGGDRDRGKRPVMGRISERLADRVYVTSDNPRTEDPGRIIAEIVAGMQRPAAAVTIADRGRAIARAIADCNRGDMLLIAGKGHETYQILGSETIAFDDREVARSHLA